MRVLRLVLAVSGFISYFVAVMALSAAATGLMHASLQGRAPIIEMD